MIDTYEEARTPSGHNDVSSVTKPVDRVLGAAVTGPGNALTWCKLDTQLALTFQILVN